MEIQRRHHDLADIAFGYGIAGAGPHDFQDQVLVDDRAVAGRGLKGYQAEIGANATKFEPAEGCRRGGGSVVQL
jgi:hypothetical protein